MKRFGSINYDIKKSVSELKQFESFLQSKTDLSEKKDLLPFFKKRKNLIALLHVFNPEIKTPNLWARELKFFGDFACDFAVGNSNKGQFSFIEFEDGRKSSVFQEIKRTYSTWGPRLEHGFSQIVDWLWKIDINSKDEIEELFHTPKINFTCLLISGRSSYIRRGERKRLEWRNENIVIGKSRIYCMTFDDLCNSMIETMKSYEKW